MMSKIYLRPTESWAESIMIRLDAIWNILRSNLFVLISNKEGVTILQGECNEDFVNYLRDILSGKVAPK